jgi:hypothetical protein
MKNATLGCVFLTFVITEMKCLIYFAMAHVCHGTVAVNMIACNQRMSSRCEDTTYVTKLVILRHVPILCGIVVCRIRK